MSEPGQEKQLGGLARSIGALFSEPEGADDRHRVDGQVSLRDEQPEGPEDHGPAEERAAAPAPVEELEGAPPGFARLDALLNDLMALPTSPPDSATDRAAEVDALLADVARIAPAESTSGGALEASDAVAISVARVPHDDLARRVVAELGAERDDGRREALIGACVRLGPAAAAELAVALAEGDDRGGRRAYLDALVAMGTGGMPVVEGMMDDDRWYVLRNGLAILGEIGGEDALGAIVGALGRPEAKVRREALIALAKIGGEDAGQLALGMLEDPDPAVRTAAARAVGELGVQRAHRRLVQMLGTEDDTDLVVAVLRALGQLGDPGAVHAIERHAVGSFLRKPPPEVRITAYRALRQIGTPHARRLLNQAVDDREPVVKQAVRQLLGMA